MVIFTKKFGTLDPHLPIVWDKVPKKTFFWHLPLKGSYHKKNLSPKPHILDSNGVWSTAASCQLDKSIFHSWMTAVPLLCNSFFVSMTSAVYIDCCVTDVDYLRRSNKFALRKALDSREMLVWQCFFLFPDTKFQLANGLSLIYHWLCLYTWYQWYHTWPNWQVEP